MKALLTIFSATLIAGHIWAQTSTNLGSGLNNPGAGLGNGVGTPAAPIGASPIGNSSSPTPTLDNQSDAGSTFSNPMEEQQQMEDSTNFNQGAYGGSLGSGGTLNRPSGALPSGSGMGSSPTMAVPNGPIP